MTDQDDQFSTAASEIIRRSVQRFCGEIATAHPSVPPLAYSAGLLSVAMHYLKDCDQAERAAARDAFLVMLRPLLGEDQPPAVN